ncbi:MAG: trigger factor [Bacteroidales bacterium]|nr:trigger factor [Bacteroidales bacterium]
MEIQRNEIGNLHEVISITLEKNDYIEQVEKSLRKLRQKVQIKGFRPGMAPMSLVSKLYKKSVILDEVEKLIQQRILDYIKEQNIDTLGTPILSENNFNAIDIEEEPTFKITFELGLRPKVDIKLTKKDKVTVYKIEVDEDSINKYLDYYKRTYGQDVDAEEVGENSIVKGEVYDEKNPEEPLNTEGVILISVIQDKKIKKQFIGKKIEDMVVFDAIKAFPNKKDLALLINKKEEELPETLTLRYVIKSIKDFKEAELNQELWNKIYGENVVTSYDEFIEKIKQEIKEYRDQESQYKLRLDLKKKLLSKVQVELPEAFLKRQLKENSKKELSDEVIESEFPMYLDAIKEQLIYSAIQKEHNIQVSEDDMLDGAREIVKNQFKQYGIYNLPENYVSDLAPKVLKNEKEANRIFEMKLEDKILEVVKNLITLEEKEIAYEDFIKKLKEEK